MMSYHITLALIEVDSPRKAEHAFDLHVLWLQWDYLHSFTANALQ